MLLLAGFGCGFIFGWGLLISGMVKPEKVLGFLDIFGAWDASLAVVMAAALAVSSAGFLFASRYPPLLAPHGQSPSKRAIDASLIVGSALFGAGWGLVGLCPGPAIENLATLSPRVIVFVIAVAAGMALHDAWQRRQPAAPRVAFPRSRMDRLAEHAIRCGWLPSHPEGGTEFKMANLPIGDDGSIHLIARARAVRGSVP